MPRVLTARELGLGAEPHRRRFSIVIATLALLCEAAITVLDAVRLGPPITRFLEPLIGTLICAALLMLLTSRRVPIQAIDQMITATVTLVFAAELILAFLAPGPPDGRLYLIGLLVLLCAFITQPGRLPLVWAGGIMAAFVALVWTHPGGTGAALLVETALVTLLVVQLAIYGRQASTMRRQGEAYRDMAFTDPLTGVGNRRAMYAHLDRAIERRRVGEPFSVVLLDLDSFKRVNDQFGHDTGDQVLQLVAATLQRHLRPDDRVARWGGEEFLVLLPSTDALATGAVTERLWQALREARAPLVPPVTASLGAAVADGHDTVTTVLRRADEQLYRAKNAGRDCWYLDSSAEQLRLRVQE